MLLDEEAWEPCFKLLTARDFFDRKHQVIWECAEEAVRSHGRADGITILEPLKHHPRARPEFRGYIASLLSEGVGAAHARGTAEIVLDYSVRRQDFASAQRLEVAVLEGRGYRTVAEEIVQGIAARDRTRGLPEGLVNLWDIKDDGLGWVVTNFIKPQQRMFIFGNAAVGKSMLMCQAAIQAWAGIPVLGKWSPVRRTRCLYVDLEMGASTVSDRARTFQTSARQEAGEDLGRFDYWMNPDGLDLSRPESRRALENAVAHVRPELLVIDPFYKVLSGDMYTPKDVRPATEFLDFIRKHYGCAMWLGHHNKKSVDGFERTPTLGDLFGASILQWWPEFVLVLEKDRLVVRKSRERWFEEGQEIPLSKGGKWWATAHDGAILNRSEQEILDYLMENRASGLRDLSKHLDLPVPEVRRLVGRLLEVEAIRKQPSDRGGWPMYEAVTT